MDSRMTIKQRKRNFLTWMLIFVMVFNWMAMDAWAADVDLDSYWESGAFVGLPIVFPGDTIFWGETDGESYDIYYYIGDDPYNPEESKTINLPRASSTTSGNFVVQSVSQLGMNSVSNNDVYGWRVSSIIGSGQAVGQINLQAILMFKVTYDVQGHGTAPATQSVSDGGLATRPTPDPTDEGVTFGGWYTESECSTEWDFSDPVYESMVLYAKWTPKTYTITWKDYDGTTLSTNIVTHGDTPVYGGARPFRIPSESVSYDFIGWNPEIEAATCDKTYTAVYTESPRKYTITWNDYDDSLIDTTEVAYGVIPTHAAPERNGDAEYSYTFSHWSPEPVPVTGNATYTASYNQAKKKYTVLWKNYDGTVIETDTDVEYGATPSFNSALPTKPSDAQNTYTFSHWSPAVGPITGNTEYVAKYTDTLRKYTVTWVNYDDSVIKKDTAVPYGTTATYTGDTPSRNATAQYTYTFAGWTPEPTVVTRDDTYKATYTETLNRYNVTFVDEDNTKVLKAATAYDYGTLSQNIVQPPEPVKAPTAQYTYTFSGWSPELEMVSRNRVYKATYSASVNKYSVTFVDEDGTTVLKPAKLYDYGTLPGAIEKPADPHKESTTGQVFTFAGWSPEIKMVSRNAVYRATYTSAPRQYGITFVDEDGTTVLKPTVSYNYGTVSKNIVQPKTPTKTADAQYTYTFSHWDPVMETVSRNMTYKAVYSASVNRYTITWKNDNGTVLETDTGVPYGTMPSYDGVTPVKTEDKQYTYTFAGWSPAVVSVTGDATYTATFDGTKKKYNITWKDGDNATLKTDSVSYGDMPAYTGATPTKTATAQYTYTFNGKWTPTIVPVSQNATYTALFDAVVNKYTVTWKNEDGTNLEIDTEVPYGATPDYGGPTPAKESTVSMNYTFAGWSPAIKPVSGNAVYTATYTGTPRQYSVTFVDDDEKTVLKEAQKYDYGTPASGIVKPDDPEKAATAQYTYTFSGWTPEITAVSADAVYKATYSASVNKYNVYWRNEDGTLLKTDTAVEYGSYPVYTGDTPVKAGNAQYSYTFDKWSPDPASTQVVGDTTFYATYTETVNKYTVSWNNYDGTLLEKDTDVEYGTVPSYDGDTPVRPSTVSQDFTYDGWSPAITAVSGNITYTALYAATPRKYTITWKNYDNTTISTCQVAYGETPVYTGDTPVKPGTAQFSYEFNGWSPAIVPVVADATYTAQYTETTKTYTITWKNSDGSTLETDTGVAYGTMPSYDGEVPVQAEDAGNTYSFLAWSPEVVAVTGDATYYATYTNTPKQFNVTFVDEDGTTILKGPDAYVYGTAASAIAVPEDPKKEMTAQYSYEFAGWSPTLSDVIADAVYKATYIETLRTYNITWKNEDGSVLKTDSAAYGSMPEYTGETPVKTATAQYEYIFDGWTPDIATVTGDAEYTAVYKDSLRKYNISWKNYDGTLLESGDVAYGDIPVYAGETPKRADTKSTTYSFKGWTPEIVAVTGAAEYTAEYDEAPVQYKIRFVDDDGVTILKAAAEYDYGTPASKIKTPGTPYKAPDDENEYSFAGWSPALSKVTKDQTYKAVYNATPIEKKAPAENNSGESSTPATVPPVTTAAPANAVRSPQTGEDNRRMMLIGASAFSISMILLGSLLKKKRKQG